MKTTAVLLLLFIALAACILPAAASSSLPDAAFVANTTSGIVPLTVKFVDETDNTPTSWIWSFGDGGTSISQNPVHTYTLVGTYTVTLTATNAAGSDTATKTSYITVTKTTTAPVANLLANITSGEAPLSVQFVDSSTGSPTSWTWSFGDGGTSSSQNPVHVYKSSGTYTVTLTTTNAGGSNTITQTGYITVNTASTAPVANFISTAKSGTAPLTIQFIDSSTNSPTSWLWSFGDGNSSSEQNPSHTYEAIGSYTVTLTATNSAGSDTVTEKGYITVDYAEPVASFAANVTSGYAPLAVQFTDTSTNSSTDWAWNFGDGSTSTSQNPVHVYNDAGTYTVKLTASNDAGDNTTRVAGFITVTTLSAPQASFIADTRHGIAPLAVQFNDTSTNSPTAWVWSFGDGAASTQQNPSHNYTEPGSYKVSLEVSNAAGTNNVVADNYVVVTAAGAPAAAVPSDTIAENVQDTPSPEETGVPVATQTVAQKNTGSGNTILYIVIALAAIAGIGFFFLRRPPKGPHHGHGREL